MEYLVDDAREQSFTKFAVFEQDSKFVNYDLGEEDIENHCSMTGVDLTKIAEKELTAESEEAEPASHLRAPKVALKAVAFRNGVIAICE
jgi:hypothetical protein